MTRDHKLILGGSFGGIGGCLVAMGAYSLAVAMFCLAAMLVYGAGRG